MAVTAVGFDLDYTLAVPDRDRETLLAEATAAAGAPPISREEYLSAHGRNLTGETRAPIFADLLAGSGADPEAVARAYREAVNEALVPVEGVEALLSDLRASYRVGLLTNGPSVAQRGKLAALGWEDAFDAALVSGDLPAGKPDRRAFAALLDALGSPAGETVYVGDQPEEDVRGAAAAGLHAIQVTYPDGPDPDPRADAHLERAALREGLPDALASL